MSHTTPTDTATGTETPTNRSPDSPDSTGFIGGLQREFGDSPLFKDYLERLVDDRDLQVVITARHSERGVGKTTLAYGLASLFDVHGWTAEKATLDPREFARLKTTLPRGSSLLLDEAEQAADRRRSMSKETMGVGHAIMTGRYRQIWGIYTLPSLDMLDRRIVSLCNYHIKVTTRGAAEVRAIHGPDEEDHDVVDKLSWPAFDDHREFQRLHEKRVEHDKNGLNDEWVHRDEADEKARSKAERAAKETRYEILRGLWEDERIDVKQSVLADAIGTYNREHELTQSRVSQIVNSESFDEVYKG